MDINCTSIKKKALEDLKGKWGLAILSTLIFSLAEILISVVFNSEGILYNLISLIYEGTFLFGYTAVILNISRRKDVDLSQLFAGCKKFLKGIGVKILINIYTALWSLLLVIPGIMASISYSMTYYIWIDNPDVGIDEAITKSKALTDGHKMEIFTLYLSFLGWFLLILTPAIALKLQGFDYILEIMTIGIIFLVPYIDVCIANVYNTLIKEHTSNFVEY